MTSSNTATATPTATVSPYCAVAVYQYYSGFDIIGNATLGSALIDNERDCARACCDIQSCDGYSYLAVFPSSSVTGSNCYFTGGVTGITYNHVLNAGVRTRALS